MSSSILSKLSDGHSKIVQEFSQTESEYDKSIFFNALERQRLSLTESPPIEKIRAFAKEILQYGICFALWKNRGEVFMRDRKGIFAKFEESISLCYSQLMCKNRPASELFKPEVKREDEEDAALWKELTDLKKEINPAFMDKKKPVVLRM